MYIQFLAQIMPLFNYKIIYYKIISMSFCSITISHSSTPYDISGEMFKLLPVLCETFLYLTSHTQAGVTFAGPYIYEGGPQNRIIFWRADLL